MVRVAGVGVVAVGLMVLAGWTWDVAFLKGPLPGFVQMKADTAIGFVALGASLLLTAPHGFARGRRVAGGLALLAALIGAVTLAEYLLGRDLGIDQLLFTDTSTVHTVHPGRLAPQTAFGFLAVGAALFALQRRGRQRRRLAHGLAGAAFALALFAVLGYAYGAPTLTGAPSLTPIAPYTALTLLLLCVGVFACDPAGLFAKLFSGTASGGLLARRMLPLGAIGLPLLGWLLLEGERLGMYPHATGVALLVLTGMGSLAVVAVLLGRRLNQLDAARGAAVARERRLASLVDVSNEAIFSANAHGVVETWNSASKALFGYDETEIVGRHVRVLCPPEQRREQQAKVDEVLAGRRRGQSDVQRLHKDGRRLDVSLTSSAIVEDGAITGFCVVAHDIGPRLRAQADLAASLEERTRELDEARLEAFHKLALAAEYRDDETRDHTRRVGELSAALAIRLGLEETTVEIIRQVAPLHDLGKIGIADSILLKPGKLTAAEFATMKEHARIGAEILAGSDSPLFLIAGQIAGSHHERWDGTGYPDGLAAQEIPIAARIVGLVDVFDALTHERPYKQAWPLEQALAEIARLSGTHFDPRIATAFATLDHATLLAGENRPSHPLGQTALTSLRATRPSAGLGVSATDERWVAEIFRNSTYAVLIADDERRYVAGNKAACHLLGIAPDELVGKRIDDFAPSAAHPALDSGWMAFLRSGTRHAPVSLVRADGTPVELSLTAWAHFAPGLHLSILEPNARTDIGVYDPARLEALMATRLLDSPPEEAFDRVTRLVAEELAAPVALISLVAEERQFFKSQVGLSGALAEARQTPLSHSFCRYTVSADAPIIVTDTRRDPRFRENPAIRDHDVAAYLGVPIRGAGGHVLGALCAIDTEPRPWTGDQIQTLLRLGELVTSQIQRTQSTAPVGAGLSATPVPARNRARTHAAGQATRSKTPTAGTHS